MRSILLAVFALVASCAAAQTYQVCNGPNCRAVTSQSAMVSGEVIVAVDGVAVMQPVTYATNHVASPVVRYTSNGSTGGYTSGSTGSYAAGSTGSYQQRTVVQYGTYRAPRQSVRVWRGPFGGVRTSYRSW